MGRPAELLRFIIASPEFLIILLGIGAEYLFSIEIANLINDVDLSDEWVKAIAAVPIAAAAWMLMSGKKLLFPEKDKENILQAWPDYWKLKLGFWVAFAYLILFALLAMVAWAMDWKRGASLPWVLMMTAVAGGSAAFLSLFAAQMTVDEAIARYKPTIRS